MWTVVATATNILHVCTCKQGLEPRLKYHTTAFLCGACMYTCSLSCGNLHVSTHLRTTPSLPHCTPCLLIPLLFIGGGRSAGEGEPSTKKLRMDGGMGMMYTQPVIPGMGPPMIMPGMTGPILPGMAPPGKSL